jgi:hypothetical protein
MDIIERPAALANEDGVPIPVVKSAAFWTLWERPQSPVRRNCNRARAHKQEERMLKVMLTGAVAAAALVSVLAPARAADPYTFALVPKATNNPFYDQALAGCKKAEKELKGAIKCLYIGPSEHGGGDEEAQIVADLITKKVDGIAVSPANAPAMAVALKEAAPAHISRSAATRRRPLGNFEATRYARGHKALYTFEINGEQASISWDLHDLHRLQYFDHRDEGIVRGWRSLHVTDSDHPYMKRWWVPGLQIGYEHTFIHQAADFLDGLASGKPAAPTFRDALMTDRVTDAVLRSAASEKWERV